MQHSGQCPPLSLEGYSITTAQIFYHFPDHPHLLQLYVWQDYDFAPEFPKLMKFAAWWHATLDGPIHEIEVAHQLLLTRNEIERAVKRNAYH